MANSMTISREKHGKNFVYVKSGSPLDGEKIIEWIESLAIPPAWKDVKISQSPRAKVYAQGYDEAGRKQAIYSPAFRAKQEKLKFDRMLHFASALPALRKQVDKDLNRRRLNEAKVLACIVKLIDESYFRVGNERYAKENNSYGITTLRNKHVEVKSSTVTFDFVGKSGKQHIKKITDKQVAAIVKQLEELPGHELFQYLDQSGRRHNITSKQVNNYIKEHMGDEFSAKDFRTWGGTLLATTELLALKYSDDAKKRQKLVAATVKNVAKRLGNTPAVARSSYIDPRVIALHDNSGQLQKMQKAIEKMRPRKYMNRDELALLQVLQANS